jgi:NADH:ubiquinone oxidoreductase subunit
MTITTRLYTTFYGQLVGQDEYGNRYFRRKGKTHGASSSYDKRRHEKRWVLYKGTAEPSKVPAEWHGWLHYTHDVPPSQKTLPHHEWEKPHLPNLTGTTGAYVPQGSLLASAEHAPTVAEYTPWKPQ